MTDSTPAVADDAALPAVPEDLETGLEDFESSDFVMPRLKIVMDEAVFKDSLTGETFNSFECVILGLVKGRILWDQDVDEGDTPLCKSFNFREGHPKVNEFPWSASGFDKPAEDSGVVLPCEACNLKEWGTNPASDAPWCSEQHTFPVMMVQPGEEGEQLMPALLTVQRSAIKNSKRYMSAFARTKTPLYTTYTKIELSPQKRGAVRYAVPEFTKLSPTDSDQYPMFAETYRSIRSFITTPPKPRDEEKPVGAATAAAEEADDDDEVPF
jgi:hypothetical protein